jgi:fructose-bisphosphate aldolase class II
MPLTPTADIVARARTHRIGVGSFNVIQLEHAEAIAAGAEAARAPAILQISENTARSHGGLAAIGAAWRIAADAVLERAPVPEAFRADRTLTVTHDPRSCRGAS